MPETVKIAVVQMVAQPAPLEQRLARAENLIDRAAQQGAQLVVLPEVFNTGYSYRDRNYTSAETFDGQTPAWMRRLAARRGLHLAGSFLRSDQRDIYNTLFLVAPDGRSWHYDKCYPWMWERAYFRPGKSTAVADTDLGKIGMLICWDVAHLKLWRSYAGRIELMLVCSCPPAAHNLRLILPDGKRIAFEDLGWLTRRIRRTSGETFGACLRRQAGNLGVPVVNTTGTGLFLSAMPGPRLSLAAFASICPQLWRYISQAERVCLEAGYFNETYIAAASGEVMGRVPPEFEDFALAEISLPDAPPRPSAKPPPFGISIFAYLFDSIANAALAREYRRKVDYHLGWGPRG